MGMLGLNAPTFSHYHAFDMPSQREKTLRPASNRVTRSTRDKTPAREPADGKENESAQRHKEKKAERRREREEAQRRLEEERAAILAQEQIQ